MNPPAAPLPPKPAIACTSCAVEPKLPDADTGSAAESAELPLQSHPSQAGSVDDLIVGDVIGLECAGVDVAQDEVGRAGAADRGNAGKLPIEAHRAQRGGIGDLIVGDVVDLQSAGIDIAQEEIGFAGNAAEIADARELQSRPTAPMKTALVI